MLMKGIDFSLQVNNARKYASCLASVDPENPLLNYMNYEFPDFPALFERYETHDMPEAVHMYVLEMKEAYSPSPTILPAK